MQRISRKAAIAMARGRDAADVAIFTTSGAPMLRVAPE
jgi:hypothetical protein